ncbi:MAG: phospholipase D-like domain-containing protein [Candidatus Krumholzibacteria bacterium]|nr:phospholipase D-like domain-containing protein [Candidatus Krumholzibacteria bacterium]MDP6669437.1 phospholipase D-like domain-containing protein [Candidatus Krumholzibacteria bacterium]MDP7021956.1 phospholipase D-like domain-containing protein [Candidatus Krumholzibacteria bacterium]
MNPTESLGSSVFQLSLDRNPRQTTLSALASAGESVNAVVYKFKDPRILSALQEAAKRGVALRILLDAKEAAENAGITRALQECGAELRLWPRSRGKLHAKFLIIDSRQVLSGSYNWTLSGAGKNVELLNIFESSADVQRHEELFAQLWKMASP